MTKLETITFEYEHCGECSNADWSGLEPRKHYCLLKKRKKIPELWGQIPKWCPLPDKVDK
jgi:hypothetical protein